MSRLIEGILVEPDGSPLGQATIIFRADETSIDGVPTGVSSFVNTDSDGAYSVELENGRYTVILIAQDRQAVLGRGTVTDGPTITLPELLGLSGVGGSLAQDLLDRVIALEAGGGGGGLPLLGSGPADEITTANAAGTSLARSGWTIASLLSAARDRASHTGTQLAATISDFAAAVGSLLTWSAISGKPSTFTPSAHASTHATAGSDPIAPADIGAAPASHTHTATQISDSTAVGRSVLTAATAADARAAIGTDAAGDARPPTTHTHTAAQISDSTTIGRDLLTAANAGAARTALGLGDSATRDVGTTAGTVAAGDDSRLSDARAPTAHTHPLSDLTQSGATTGQVPQWDGTAWVPTTPSSGGGSPGGSDGQLQYRVDATTFGGMSGTSWNDSIRALTSTAESLGGTSGSPTLAGLTFVNSTAATVSQPQFSPSIVLEGQGWKTNAPAGSQPTRFALQVEHFNNGNVNPRHCLAINSFVGGVWRTSLGISHIAGNQDGYWNGSYLVGFDGATNYVTSSIGFVGFGPSGGNGCFSAYAGGRQLFGFTSAGGSNLGCGVVNATVSSGFIGWTASSATSSPSNFDTRLFRDAARTLALRDGTNANTFRVYNTESSSLANHERLSIRWASNVCTITPQAAGTGTLRPLIVRHPPVTLATLPSAATAGAGARSFISDATATTFASVAVGGGSNTVPVYSDGTDWRIG